MVDRATYLRFLDIRRNLRARDVRVPGMVSLKLWLGGEASSGLRGKIGGVVGLLLNIKNN